MSDQRKDDDQSPEQIESRIRSTQDDLRHDLDALEDKVSPENLKRQAKERMDETTEMLKEKAVETTRHAGEAVRHKIDDVTDGFRKGERMSTMSLIGLVAVIGIGLLLTRESRHRDRYDERPYAGRTGTMDRDLRRPDDFEASYPHRY